MAKVPNSIRRSTVSVSTTITWPRVWSDWDALPGEVRNKVRALMDEVNDLITVYASSGAERP